jgi:hypothetical protein
MGVKEMSISKILQGIDQDEICDKDGWWETSAGAAFGRLKLVEAQGYEFGLLSRIEALEASNKHLREVAAIQHDFEEVCEFYIKCGCTPDALHLWYDKNVLKIEALEKAYQWQPIETAPKDGKEYLFYTDEIGQCVMYWDDFQQAWGTGFDGEKPTPTHWQPLPKPPIAGEAT